MQGNLRIGQSAPPKDARFGATRRSIAGKAGDAGRGGNSEDCIRGAAGCLRNWGNPENQESESAGRCEIRGDSKIHRRHSQRTRKRGNPQNRRPARPRDAGYGATRRRKTSQAGRCKEKRQLGTFIKRLNGTMHDPMSYQITRRTPEAARLLAFS